MRAQFQDWITERFGTVSIERRDELWAAFKEGKRVALRRRHVA